MDDRSISAKNVGINGLKTIPANRPGVLEKKNIHMEPKSFAVGLRAEHPQTLINQYQYGKSFQNHSDILLPQEAA